MIKVGGKLSKKEEYCIRGMLLDNKSIPQIANMINRGIPLVEKYIEDYQSIIEEDKLKETRAKEHLINKTSGKKNTGVSVMTKAASEQGDFVRDNLPPSTSRTSQEAIHRIEDNVKRKN
jgi:coenzyme F420-reducing hydrogenase alpha subunit